MSFEQSIRLFQIVNKHFKNEEDSRVLVSEIESFVEQRIENKSVILSTKEDVTLLKDEIVKLEKQGREDISRLEIKLESGFKDHLKWTIILMLGFVPILVAVIKFL